MKGIHPRLVAYLHFISRFFKSTYPRHIFSYDSDSWATAHYAAFAIIILFAVLYPTYCFTLNINILVQILIPKNNIFIFGTVTAYVTFTGVVALLFFGILYLMAFMLDYMETYSTEQHVAVLAMFVVLEAVEITIVLLWCIYIYYAYIYLVQILFICFLEKQTGLIFSIYITAAFFLLLFLRYMVSKYLPRSRVASVICASVTLAFFNLLIAFIFGPFLLCKNIEIFILTFGREVHVCLLCTIWYLLILVIDGKWPLKFWMREFYILAGFVGLVLGSHILLMHSAAILAAMPNSRTLLILWFAIYISKSLMLLIVFYFFFKYFFFSEVILLKILKILFWISLILIICFFVGMIIAFICLCVSSGISL